jgi:uncharacterized phage protein (TIGR01671 family)
MKTENRYLFRGISKETGDWVYGGICYQGDTPFITVENSIRTVLNLSYRTQTETRDMVDAHEIIPETLGQWIGLTDKDGKKIFEWDILHYWPYDEGHRDKWTMGVKLIVKWSKTAAAFVYERDTIGPESLYEMTPDNHYQSQTEIAGSIHDRLLKVSNSTGLEGEV